MRKIYRNQELIYNCSRTGFHPIIEKYRKKDRIYGKHCTNARSFKGMCNACGIIGHNSTDFFKLEKNKDKTDEFMKKRNENNASNRKQNNHRGPRHDNRNTCTSHRSRDYRNHQDKERNDRNNRNT
jgi:hypothetical protein